MPAELRVIPGGRQTDAQAPESHVYEPEPLPPLRPSLGFICVIGGLMVFWAVLAIVVMAVIT